MKPIATAVTKAVRCHADELWRAFLPVSWGVAHMHPIHDEAKVMAKAKQGAWMIGQAMEGEE